MLGKTRATTTTRKTTRLLDLGINHHRGVIKARQRNLVPDIDTSKNGIFFRNRFGFHLKQGLFVKQ